MNGGGFRTPYALIIGTAFKTTLAALESGVDSLLRLRRHSSTQILSFYMWTPATTWGLKHKRKYVREHKSWMQLRDLERASSLRATSNGGANKLRFGVDRL